MYYVSVRETANFSKLYAPICDIFPGYFYGIGIPGKISHARDKRRINKVKRSTHVIAAVSSQTD